MFSWLPGQRARTGLLPQEAEAIVRACAALGIAPPKWRGSEGEFVYGSRSRRLPNLTLRSILPAAPDPANDTLTLLALAELLDMIPPAAVLSDLKALAPLLRPRLIHPRELAGPRRSMCRRESFGGLLQAVSIGPSHAAPLVTTAILDRWPVSFDEAAQIACDNLQRTIEDKDLHEIAGTPGVLAFVSDHEQAASAAFLLERFTADAPGIAVRGMVFAVPHEDLLLLLPVIPGAGPDGLAALVQTTLLTAGAAADPMCESLFWYLDRTITELPMTTVVEGRSRRVHLEARGPVEDLLRILGALE